MPRIKWGLMARISLLVLFSIISFKTYNYFAVYVTQKMRPLYLDREEVAGPDAAQLDEEYTEDPKDLNWFAHVTDIHISKFYDPQRAEDLRSLCSFFAKTVRPFAVVVSGDLTDGKLKNFFGSEQQPEEWVSYSRVVRDCGKWLDIRGNHDTFNVAHDDSDQNFFRDFSAQGKNHSRSYVEILQGQTGKKSFGLIALDLTTVPGLKRPLNFFGILTQKELDRVRELLKEADKSDYTVVFGHYPSSSVTGIVDFREVLAGRVYLCGHYHTVYGHNYQIFTRYSNGLLELELGDWKDYRRYRIMAFDQGLLSFTDAAFKSDATNIVTLVTNPPDTRFLRPRDPFSRVKRSKKVRALVFSDVEVKEVTLILPSGKPIAMTNEHLANVESSPLYTAPWAPEDFTNGLHILKIRILLTSGLAFESEHYFSLDGSQKDYDLMSRIILMLDWPPFSKLIFSFTTFVTVMFLVTLRVFYFTCENNGSCRISWFLRKYLMLASLDSLFLPLVLALIWHCFLPWALGNVLEDRMGIIFPWGVILLEGFDFVPPDLTYLLGNLTLVFHVFPLIWVLAGKVQETFESRNSCPACLDVVVPRDSRNVASHWELVSFLGNFLQCHASLILLFIFYTHSMWAFSCMYGSLAIVGPYGLGKLWLLCHLYMHAINISESELAELQLVWQSTRR